MRSQLSNATGAVSLAVTLLLATGASAAPARDDVETTKTTAHKSKRRAEPTKDQGTVAADNTGTNKRDRKDNEATADQQGNQKSDVDLTAEIRRAITDDKSLSTNAHNVKIIARDGDVTLKGPVASDAEKAAVEKLASKAAGKGKVMSELAVAH